ncbi:MAG: hypothetical protein IJ849_04675 [Selenomonadaceae bacterium]|nr:hypothetical protein [Selenomonadaceae bacterium]
MVEVIKIEDGIADDGLSDALRKISVARARIPMIEVRVKGIRISFIAYFIRYEDPVYGKVKIESPEDMIGACQPVYFYLPKDRKIDISLLVNAIKTKIQGKIRRQLKEQRDME